VPRIITLMTFVCLAKTSFLPGGEPAGPAAAKLVRLTADGQVKADPVFTPNGEEVLYTVFETPSQMSLMRLRIADGQVERLHPEATTSEFEIAIPRHGNRYAFVRSRANLNVILILRDRGLNRDSVVDPGAGFTSLGHPAWAPDGSRLAYAKPTANGQEIVTVDPEGKNPKTLAAEGLNAWPAYSPDGRLIAFSSSRDGDFDLYRMNADGSNVQRLLRRPGMDARPAWSPDGRRLAFLANQEGNYNIAIMDADGSNFRIVVDHPERDDYPAWHPNGKKLVFVGERHGKFDLYLLDVP
jgi:WD40 repeat protein